MATVPAYAEQTSIPRESGVIGTLVDFSFQRMATPRMLKMIYGLHLLLGLIVAIGFVFKGFQISTSNGLLAMILGAAGLFLWMIYCRVAVELLAVIFRAAGVITNSQN